MCVFVKTFLVLCVYVFLYLYNEMYVYMSECVYVFMYLYVCNPMRGREIERGGDKFLEGNLIALKNVVICLHDPIILYLAHGF